MKIRGKKNRPRVYIFKSNKHIYAHVIDDHNKKILTTSSSLSLEIKKQTNEFANCKVAKLIGKNIAIKLKELGISQIIFDRGHNTYHGQIKELAEAARSEGIKF
uniref:Large ribosomal subunit protein uL18c n=1 Tax=Cliftonaea pectinata TaxID=2007206 RepID=A0A1Z1MQS4_9FLOR|nr:ribosomal protein L18 [Cliftonaea pectinata]ARW68125.1 ribosomal protein L18 [Cliftonaea pectinata]